MIIGHVRRRAGYKENEKDVTTPKDKRANEHQAMQNHIPSQCLITMASPKF
jgi:hypothetical protein